MKSAKQIEIDNIISAASSRGAIAGVISGLIGGVIAGAVVLGLLYAPIFTISLAVAAFVVWGVRKLWKGLQWDVQNSANLTTPPPIKEALSEEIEFRKAAAAGNILKMQELKAQYQDLDINAQDPKTGNTALHLAVLGNHREACAFLLGINADPSILNKEIKTWTSRFQKVSPLFLAVFYGYSDIVELLLEKTTGNLNFTYDTADGAGNFFTQRQDIFHWAARGAIFGREKKKLEITRLILKNTKNFELIEQEGHLQNTTTPLHIAINRNDNALFKTILEEKECCVQYLSITGTCHKETPLMLAARTQTHHNAANKLTSLLQLSWIVDSINIEDQFGRTALDSYLYWAEPNNDITPNASAITPERYNAHIRIMKIFWSKGAEIGESLNKLAVSNETRALARIHISSEVPPYNTVTLNRNELHIAVMERDLKKVQQIIREDRIDINAVDDLGNTALHLAIQNTDSDIVLTLLNCPTIDINIENKEWFRNYYDLPVNNILNAAYCFFSKRDVHVVHIIQKLLEKDADPNIVGKGNTSLLIDACKGYAGYSSIELALILLANPNTDITLYQEDKKTALHCAILALPYFIKSGLPANNICMVINALLRHKDAAKITSMAMRFDELPLEVYLETIQRIFNPSNQFSITNEPVSPPSDEIIEQLEQTLKQFIRFGNVDKVLKELKLSEHKNALLAGNLSCLKNKKEGKATAINPAINTTQTALLASGGKPTTKAAQAVGKNGTFIRIKPSDLQADIIDERDKGRFQALRQNLDLMQNAEELSKYRALAERNLGRWEYANATNIHSRKIRVFAGDWGDITQQVSEETGHIYAVLNMANAYSAGGGFLKGMIAQEENMYRRTDCAQKISTSEISKIDFKSGYLSYTKEMTNLVNGENGRVYLDTEHPRVCFFSGEPEYKALPEDKIFKFYELKSAAVDLRLRDGSGYREHDDNVDAQMRKKIQAQLNTLKEHKIRHVVLSAFGCGAFGCDAKRVAQLYKEELAIHGAHFDDVVFAVYDGSYGPKNAPVFEEALNGMPLPEPIKSPRPE